VLILTDGPKPNVYMSGRNLTDTQVLNYSDVSTYHILWSEVVVIESSALGQGLGPVSDDEAGESPKAESKAAAKSAKKTTRKSATKTAGRKTAAGKTAARKTATRTAARKPARKSAAKATKRTARKKGK